jgi:hypothetical protein
MTNGPIRAIVQYGNIVWLGGQFTELRQNPPGQGGQVIPVSNLAAIDVNSGAPVPGLNLPIVTGPPAIAPGQYCSIDVIFAPTMTGTLPGTISISDNASNSPQTVSLTGVGYGSAPGVSTANPSVQGLSNQVASNAPVVSLAPATLDFGMQQVGTSGSQKTVKVNNTGTAALTVTSVVASANYDQSNTCQPIVYTLTLAQGKLYIGGSFTQVGGAPHRGLAAIDAATGVVDSHFNPNIGPVWTLAADAQRIYAGGSFLMANGKPRTRLAAFAFDGTLDSSWIPSADDRPRDMAFAPDGQSIFIVGHFKNVAGPDSVFKPRDSVARLDTNTGVVQPWIAGCPCSSQLYGIGVKIRGTAVYVGMGGSDWVASYDLNAGGQFWRTDTFGQTQDVALMGNGLVIGGHFRWVASGPGIDCGTTVCVPRLRLALLSLAGILDQNWDPSMTGDYDGVWRLLVNGSQLYAAGEFHQVHNVDQERIARFTDTNSSPAVSLTPVSWNFGNQRLSTSSAPRQITLSNTGNAPLNITSIVASAPDFFENSTCGSLVAAGTSCNITVTFTPSAAGTRLGAITITDDADNTPQTLRLAGNGVTPVASVSPSNIDFGNQQLGTTSASQTITLSNKGATALNVSSIVASGDYAASNNCGNSVAPAASCNITVSFTPTATGLRQGNITITDDASDSPQIVSLQGNGGGVSTGISFVGAVGNGANSAVNVVPINTTAGCDVVVVVAFGSTTPRVLSVNDTGGSTYTMLAAANNGVSTRIELWEAHNVTASTSVTISMSAVVKSRVEVAEYSGVRLVGVPATTIGSGSQERVSLSTLNNNSWVVAGFAEKNSTTFSPNTGNLRDSGSLTVSGSTVGAAVTDNSAATPSSVINAVATNISGPWASVAVELAP